jgi:AcrR family transcriptional regulator
MKGMSTPYEAGGRTAQKARTRDALVTAARDLVAAGVTPTVEDAALAASISRTTAYRYFPSKRALLLAAHPEIAATSMLPPNPPHDPAARLDAVVTNFSAMILDTEAQQRTMLRLSLEADAAERGALPLRQGRAVAWIAEALEGVRADLSDQEFRQLVLSIRATIGIEAIVWLVDVAGLSRSDSVALTRWSAQALLQRATTTPPPTPGRASKKGRYPRATG